MFGNTGVRLSLFDAPSGRDRTYLELRNSPRFADLRGQVEALWESFSTYADPHFRGQFPHRTMDRIWEMRLGVLLLENGFQLEPADADGPDVVVRLEGGRSVLVEAVSVSAGTGPDRVPDPPSVHDDSEAPPFPTDQICLRICQGISEKLGQYERWLESNIVQPDDHYVVAVSAGSLVQATTNRIPPLAVSACLGVGNLSFLVGSHGEPGSVRAVPRAAIIKQSGGPVDANSLWSHSHSQISAVIVDAFRLFSVPQDGGGLEFLHNPEATHPLPRNWLPLGVEYWVEDGFIMNHAHDAERLLATDGASPRS